MSALQGVRGTLLRRAAARPRSTFAPRRTTTILAVRKGDDVVVVGDGQVTMGSSVVKNNARKVRRLGPNDRVVAGFAGATADALSLFERLETKLEEHPEQLLRACVSLAKDWRTDKYLRRLDAMLLVCDREHSLYLTGTGDVLQPPDGVIGIGSGGTLAVAAARALVPIEGMDARQIAIKAMDIAADICIYTNTNYVVESVTSTVAPTDPTDAPLSAPAAAADAGGGSDGSSVSSADEAAGAGGSERGNAASAEEPVSVPKAGRGEVGLGLATALQQQQRHASYFCSR